MLEPRKIYVWIFQHCVRKNKEKSFFRLVMFGVLVLVSLLGFGLNHLYLQSEKSEKLSQALHSSFAILSDLIAEQPLLQNITMDVLLKRGVFEESFIEDNSKTIEDYFGNRINVAYRGSKTNTEQDYVAFQTLLSSVNRVNVCGIYLKLLENQEKKDYLRLVDTVSIVDRGNPEDNITFCAQKSTEECRSDVWASLSDLSAENRNNICNFYCKEYPCLLTILLTKNETGFL